MMGHSLERRQPRPPPMSPRSREVTVGPARGRLPRTDPSTFGRLWLFGPNAGRSSVGRERRYHPTDVNGRSNAQITQTGRSAIGQLPPISTPLAIGGEGLLWVVRCGSYGHRGSARFPASKRPFHSVATRSPILADCQSPRPRPRIVIGALLSTIAIRSLDHASIAVSAHPAFAITSPPGPTRSVWKRTRKVPGLDCMALAPLGSN
jgi:hypothetical protein